MLHGFGYGPEVFNPLISKLPASWRVYCPDWTRMIDEGMGSLLEVLPPSFDLCGWSLGGQLAVRLACHAPKRIRRLVLLATNMRYTISDEWPSAVSPSVFETFANSIEKNPSEAMRRFAALVAMGSSKKIRMPVEAQLAHSILLRQIGWLRDWDTLDMAATVMQPTCCLHGDSDRIVPTEASIRLARVLPAGSYAEIPGSGHAVFLSNPESIAVHLQGFFYDD